MERSGKIRRRVDAVFGTVGKVQEWFEVASLCIGVFLMAALLIANVIARTFFTGIYFVEEVSQFLVLFTTFVGVSYAVRRARHIRMGALFDLLPRGGRKFMIFLICGVSAATMFLMAYYSLRYMNSSRLMGHHTPSLRLPYWLFLIVVPVGFVSAGVQYIRTIYKNIVETEVWLSPDQQGEYAEEG